MKNNEREVQEANIQITETDSKQFITKEEIKKILDKKYTKVDDLNINQIEHDIKKNIFVDSVNVYSEINGNLNIYVTQKTPLFRVNNQEEKFYISAKNQFIPLSPNFSYKCMLVDGTILAEDRQPLINLIQEINRDNLLKNHIIGVRKNTNNLFTLFVNYGGYTIDFGELKNYKQKLENLKEFYRQYLCKVPEGTYKKIVLKYNNQVVGIKK
ncbi:MAG: hypothetical protein H6604_04540 [Flavobacteriales bacterium]|nr:hypothetical protein [Flavobacteriales bacterium]